MTRLNEYVISHAYGLPQEQDVIGQSTVAASGFDVEKGKWFIILNGTVQKQDIAKSVKSVIGKSKYFSTQGRVYEVTTDSKYNTEVVKSNPPGQVQTVVSGGVTSQRVRKNPVSVSDFRSEMDGMLVSDPRRDFKVIDAPTPFGGESFRDVLFSFVSYRGESYGWTKGNKIYHRRGSLIMPKLKVNRAVEGAKMFYHTHPSKDEPSLSSADDYQFYFDLAFAFGIKHFYTIMENRLDHFEITVKKSKEEDYLKMDEDKVLDDINSIIDASEAEITKKHKSDKNLPDEKFYAKMTKDTVTRLNRRFGDFATIKYKGHANPKIVRENPSDAGFRHNPPIRISHIHKASQLEELRDTTNNFEHYGANEYGHSQYVYWWVDHHFSSTNIHPQGRLYKLKELGLDDDNRRLLRAYMEEEVAPGYSKLDILLLLALYHDVGKKREKEQGIHHSIIASNMFQDEIGPELNLPQEVSDVCALLMLTDCGRKNIAPEAFKSQAGDYLGVAYALQIADMLAHHPFMFTSLASEAKQEGRLDKANVEQYKVMVAKELFGKIADFLQTRVKTNPPPVAKSIIYAGSYDSPIDGDIAEQYLEVKKKHNGQLFIPIEESDATVTLGLSSGSFRTTMSRAKGHFTEEDPFGADLAVSLYEQIGRVLSDFTPGLSFAEAPEPAVMVNPRHAKKIHVVTVAGPTVTGKQAVIEEVARMTGGVVIPTVTTRPKRKHEAKSTDRIFVSDSKFKEMIEQGEFVEWNKAKNGYMFGRRFSDFTKPVAVVDVNLRNVSKYQDSFPNTTSVFLDPDMTPAKLATKLRSEVAVTKEQAATKAKQINKQVADAQHVPFDMVIKSQGDKPHATAKQISDDIERQNPSIREIISENDQNIVDSYKTKVKLVSPLVHYNKRVMGVFEIPVVEKNRQTGDLVNKGPVRLLFYSRTGTGSEGETKEEDIAKAGRYWKRYKEGTVKGRLDLVAESPFFRKILGEKHGRPFGMTFDPTMFAVMFGEATDDRFHWIDKDGYKRGGAGWYIKPSYSTKPAHASHHTATTVPIFPSHDWEADFAQRFGHRTMFYAGVAIAQMIPDPFKDSRVVPSHKLRKQFTSDGMNFDVNVFMARHNACLEETEWGKLQQSMGLDRSYDQQYARANPKPHPLPKGWPLNLRYLSADSSVEDQYPGIHDHPLGPITLWHGSPHAKKINSFIVNGIIPASKSGIGSEAGGMADKYGVSLTPYRWEAHDYAMQSARKEGAKGTMIFTPESHIALMIGVRGSLLEHPDYTTSIDVTWDSYLTVPHVPPEYIVVFGYIWNQERYTQPAWVQEHTNKAVIQKGESVADWAHRVSKEGTFSVPASKLKGPAFNPKSREEWFMDWAKLINMKNKELEAFLDSPLGKKAGLSPSEAKEQGIHSGRVSGRAILRMRKKIGLGGPKDYIKGPVHAKAVFQKAKRKWNDNDWEWCARQVRFNKRFMGDWMGKRKGPLVRKGQPTRRLLALWVWGFDPWRYARKVEKRKTMPKCPKVPWIGRTEKRMYGVQSEEVKMNPPWSLESQENPYIMLKEPWSTFEVPIDERLAPLVLHLWQNNVPTSYSDQGITRQGYLVIRWPYDYAEPIVKKMLKEKIIFVGHKKVWKGGDRAFPENSITIRWEKGASTLRKIYESFGLKYPTSRKKAEEMVEAMLAKENPQDKLPWLPEPAVDPATIEPHLDWPQFTKPAWLPKSMIPKTAVFSPSRATTIRGVRMVKPAFYYIPPADLNALINSQKYLELQEADRQRKIAEAEALKKELQEQGQTFVSDWKENPPAIFKKGDIIYYNNDTPKTWQGKMGSPDTLIEKYDSFKIVRVWNVGNGKEFYYQLAPIKAFNVVKKEIRLSQKFVERNFIKEPDMGSSMLPDYLVNPSAGYQVLDREKDEADTIYFSPDMDPCCQASKEAYLAKFTREGDEENYDSMVDIAMGMDCDEWRLYLEGTATDSLIGDKAQQVLDEWDKCAEEQIGMLGLDNPPNIPFPIPEEYQEELERRLTEEMTSEGYKPHTIPEVIEEGLYDDSPSDFAYAQGEYEEFLEEIEKGDFDEAYAEYSDVEGHVAYWLWTNHRIQVPIYTGTHVDKTRVRIQIFNHLFNQYGLKFGPKYLKGGSNYEKVHKVRKALDAAADDQGKPRSKDTDEEMAKKVATSVATIVKKNPPTVIATGAPHKIAEYEKHLGDGYSFNDTYDLPEVEAGPKTVAIHKAKLAYEVMGGPVLVEDTTLHIRGMSSKDASKIKWLVKNLDKHIGKRAIERVYIGYCDGEKVYLYLGQTKGTLLSPRGDKGFGYDLYFSPDGSDKTYAEEKFVSSRTKAIKKMLSDKPDYVGPMPADWKGEWQAGYSPADGINENPPNSLEEDFEWMIDNAYENLTKKIQGEDPDYDGQMWWNEQKPWIREKYGMAPVEGARWLTPIYEEDFDPDSKEGEFIDNQLTGKEDATPLHFLNQLKRIPLQREPNALRILQVALNIGQGLAADAIEERYSIEDFVAYDNPRTPGGKKFPSKYLKGLNALEKMIAEDEIDKGYKYDADDPKAYEFWKSDIKATARGLKIGTSKHRVKYYKKYRKNIDKDYKPAGNSPKQKFLNRIRKETKIKKSILEKIYDKGLAAWRVGHRPGVQQHQWAAGRVYAFAVGADSSTGPGKPDHKLAVEAGVR